MLGDMHSWMSGSHILSRLGAKTTFGSECSTGPEGEISFVKTALVQLSSWHKWVTLTCSSTTSLSHKKLPLKKKFLRVPDKVKGNEEAHWKNYCWHHWTIIIRLGSPTCSYSKDDLGGNPRFCVDGLPWWHHHLFTGPWPTLPRHLSCSKPAEEYQIPTSSKLLWRFLGMAVWYHRFKPLNSLKRKNTKSKWSIDCQTAWTKHRENFPPTNLSVWQLCGS